jgi:uncharacterized membrane protein
MMYPMAPIPGLMGTWMALVFFGCVALTVALVMLTLRIGRPWQDLPDTPKQVLDERLARGDIDLAEYQKLRALIG